MIKLIYSCPQSLSDLVSKDVLVWSRVAYEIERCPDIKHRYLFDVDPRAFAIWVYATLHTTSATKDRPDKTSADDWKKSTEPGKKKGIFQQPTSWTPLDIWYHLYFQDRAQCTSSSLVWWMGNLWILCTLDDIRDLIQYKDVVLAV